MLSLWVSVMKVKSKMLVVSSVLIILSLIGSIVFWLGSPWGTKEKEVDTSPKEVLQSKPTKELVEGFIYDEVPVNSAYKSAGVGNIKTVDEYKQLIADNSTVLSKGIKPLDGDNLIDLQSQLKEAISAIPYGVSTSTANPNLAEFVKAVNTYFGDYVGNPLQTIEVLLMGNELEVEYANFYSTDNKETTAYEFVVSDRKGNQLAYVTGYLTFFSGEFKVSYVTPLGYGQGYINEYLPKLQPPRQGL